MTPALWAELQKLADLVQTGLAPAVLVFLRIGAVMALLPAFGEQSVPARVRLVLALAFSLVIFPVVAPRLPLEPMLTDAAIEVGAGLTLGIGLRLLVIALQFAGSIAAQAASLSQLFASAGAEPQPTISTLFTLAALALATQAGLPVNAAKVMLLSYDLFPPQSGLAGADIADWGVAQVGRATSLAFSLAAPFVLAATIWNLALGLMNRAMPHLQVSMIGAPALSLAAIAVLVLTAPPILHLWLGAFAGFLAAPGALP